MQRLLDQTGKFIENEDGASAIEYALLVGLISVAMVAALTALGNKVAGVFTTMASKLPS
jgi:pilus assembly protein Flp/PilA